MIISNFTVTLIVTVTQNNTRVTIRGVGGEEAPLIEPLGAFCDTDTKNKIGISPVIIVNINIDIDIDIENINTGTSTMNSVYTCFSGHICGASGSVINTAYPFYFLFVFFTPKI